MATTSSTDRSRWSPAPRAASGGRSRCALARDGATVVGTATTRRGRRERSARRSPTAGQPRHRHALDVTDARRRPTRRSRRSRRDYGAITILVNNAGITRDNLLLRMKDDEWDAIMATNLKPAFRLAKAVLRGMMKARHGRIIQIGIGRRRERQSGPGELRGGQGRRSLGFTQVAGAGGRQPQHHGQLRGARASSTPT